VDTVPDAKAFQPQGMVQFVVEGANSRGDVQRSRFEGQPNPGRAWQRAGVSMFGHSLRRCVGFDTAGSKVVESVAPKVEHQ